MQVQKITLKNGLRVLTIPMPSMESATVQISVDAGSRDEPKKANGLAHFLEHMVFKGTKKYPSAKAVSSAVDAIGAEINANTGKERTAYFIKAWEKHLPLAFDILSGFVKEPLLKSSEIEREKGVILEEIAMYEDLPMRRVEEAFEGLLWDFSLGWDTAGTKKTVLGIKREDFVKYRGELYYPKNMVLTIAGKFDQREAMRLAEGYFGNLGKKTEKKGNGQKDKETILANPGKKPAVKLLKKKTEQAHLVLGVRGNQRGHPDRYKEAVLAGVLGGGMSSRLFTEIRERRGLAYYVRCHADHYIDNGYLATWAGIRLEKVDEAIKVILKEYQKISEGPKVPKKELEKTKEYLKGQLALSLEDTYAVAEFFGDQELFEDKIRSVEEMMRGIDLVSSEDIKKIARGFFQNNRLNLALVGPYNDIQRFERILKLKT